MDQAFFGYVGWEVGIGVSLAGDAVVEVLPVDGHFDVVRETHIVVVVGVVLEVLVERGLNLNVSPLNVLLDGDPLSPGLGLVQLFVLVLVVLNLVVFNPHLVFGQLLQAAVTRNT